MTNKSNSKSAKSKSANPQTEKPRTETSQFSSISSDETICHAFVKAKSRSSSQESLRFKKAGVWNSVSWAEYYDNVQKVAAGFLAIGLTRGKKVAIWANTRAEWSYCDMAVLSQGAVTVPIYQSALAEEIEFILANSESQILICETPSMVDKWKKIAPKCPTVKTIICIEASSSTSDYVALAEVMIRGKETLQKSPNVIEDISLTLKLSDLATLCYTSGTTGVPKGVMLTHQQIISEVSEVIQVLEIEAEDRTLTFLPFAHILGRVEQWCHVYVGFCMCYAENIDRIRDNLREVHPTFMIAVPRIFEKIYNGIISQADSSPTKKKVFDYAINVGRKVSLCKIEGRAVPLLTQIEYQAAKRLVFDKLAERLGGRLRFALCGGAPLSADIARFFHAAGVLILEGYGLTETTAAVAVNSPYKYRFGTVGLGIGDVKFKIAEDGEILVKSHKVMPAYFKNEEATKEVFTADGFFCTGDIGELTPEGFLRITDRKKDLIKTAGGKYVAPQKLENLLKLSKYISNVLIHGDKKKYIVALLTVNFEEILRYAESMGITTKDHEKVLKEAHVREVMRGVVAEANSHLASFESIKSFEVLPFDFTIENGELTPSLKVKRKFCDKKYADVIQRLYGDEPSQSEM